MLTLYLLVLSADFFCKQFGPRPDQTKHRARSGSNLFDTDEIPVPERIFGKQRNENVLHTCNIYVD